MTDDELRAIRERCEKATPGPWVTLDIGPRGGWGAVSSVADYDFLAHAREDVPALLAEVERLRGLTSVGLCRYCREPLTSPGHTFNPDMAGVELFTCPDVPPGQIYVLPG